MPAGVDMYKHCLSQNILAVDGHGMETITIMLPKTFSWDYGLHADLMENDATNKIHPLLTVIHDQWYTVCNHTVPITQLFTGKCCLVTLWNAVFTGYSKNNTYTFLYDQLHSPLDHE